MNTFGDIKGIKFISDLIHRYASSTRTFCYPTLCAFDKEDISHRRGEMIGGIPYTSASLPWPAMPTNGLFMQPIFQIDLGNASSILGVDLGSGVLQGWGPVALNTRELSVDSRDFLIRHISSESLSDSPNPEFPDWKRQGKNKSTVCYFMARNDEYGAFEETRIKWDEPMQMFGSREQFLETARDNFKVEREEFGDDEFMELADEFMEAISESPLVGGYISDYLGGFGGQAAGEYDPAYGDNLLLRLCDGEGFFYAVHWARDRNGQLQFLASFNLRP